MSTRIATLVLAVGAALALAGRARALEVIEGAPLVVTPASAQFVAPSNGEDPLARTADAPRTAPSASAKKLATALSSERARILLRSLTVPGWGQATLGHRRSAWVFGLTETAIWGAFTAFHIQSAIRTDDYTRLARTFAGIDLHGRDEEWRRIVGSFASSDEYNRLVVARDAANLYLSDPLHPDYVHYREYIAAHSLQGADRWAWATPADQERYRGERKYAQHAAQRANTALAIAVVNRIVSALHAARVAGHEGAATHAWRLEVVPAAGTDPTAVQLRVRTRF